MEWKKLKKKFDDFYIEHEKPIKLVGIILTALTLGVGAANWYNGHEQNELAIKTQASSLYVEAKYFLPNFSLPEKSKIVLKITNAGSAAATLENSRVVVVTRLETKKIDPSITDDRSIGFIIPGHNAAEYDIVFNNPHSTGDNERVGHLSKEQILSILDGKLKLYTLGCIYYHDSISRSRKMVSFCSEYTNEDLSFTSCPIRDDDCK